MKKAVPRNSPCPCGSGQKYKNCCYHIDLSIKEGKRIDATFTPDEDDSVSCDILSLDSIPTHNQNGLQPPLNKETMIQLLLDRLERDLIVFRVELIADATNRLIAEMNIVPKFTYRDVANAIENDPRFSAFKNQIVCLSGYDPIELFVDKLE